MENYSTTKLAFQLYSPWVRIDRTLCFQLPSLTSRLKRNSKALGLDVVDLVTSSPTALVLRLLRFQCKAHSIRWRIFYDFGHNSRSMTHSNPTLKVDFCRRCLLRTNECTPRGPLPLRTFSMGRTHPSKGGSLLASDGALVPVSSAGSGPDKTGRGTTSL